MTPNIIIETARFEMFEYVKIELRKRRNGMTGSSALRSTNTKATRATIEAVNNPMIETETHGNVVPPSEVPSRPVTRPTVSVAMPAKSILARRTSWSRWKNLAMNTKAARPTGRLT